MYTCVNPLDPGKYRTWRLLVCVERESRFTLSSLRDEANYIIV